MDRPTWLGCRAREKLSLLSFKKRMSDQQLVLDSGGNVVVSLPQSVQPNTLTLNVTNNSGGSSDAVDRTQLGAGLEGDGSYLAAANTNYLSGATSLFGADLLLDLSLIHISEPTRPY